MNSRMEKFKISFKDWLAIQKIRIKNFVEEHKYISSFIGVFLISSLVALIVYAADTDKYAGQVSATASVTQKSSQSTEEITTAKSFSTIVYDVDYLLSISDLPMDETVVRDEVVVQASFNDKIDAEWVTYNDITSNYELSDDGRTLTVKLYGGTKVGTSNSLQLYLNTRNIPNGTELKTNFKIKESTSSNFTELGEKKITIESEKVDLETKVVSGTAYKSNDYSEGRYAPFGILVGFDKSKLKNQNSLEGLYFDSNVSVILEAIQSVNNVNTQIELETEKQQYFGLYDKSTGLLGSMPHYQRDVSDFSVYNSGTVKNLTKSNSGVSGEVTENTNPDLYLIGDKTINLEQGEEYTEYGVSATDHGYDICKERNNLCKKTITKKGNGETSVEEKNITKEVGDYVVSYEYTSKTGVTTVKRNVKVTSKTTVSVGEDSYSLNGNKEITLVKGEKYEEKGISKNGVNASEYEISIKKNGSEDPIESVNTNEVGTYTITYTIKSQPEFQQQSATLTRTVKVVESLTYTKAPTLTASTIYAPSDGSVLDNPYVKIDAQDKECNSENKCSVKYYDLASNEEVHFDKTKVGTYKAVYTVTDENGFEIQAENTINIQTKYDFNIEGIKSDGKIDLYGDNFVSLGSYFVNAKSIRNEGVTTDILVNLTASIKKADGGFNSSTSDKAAVNKNYSAGTKNNTLSFNTDESGDLQRLSSNDYLAYGEEVILRSRFTYSNDGDEAINKLTTTIPILPFTMVEYTSRIEDKEPYYINEEYNDKVNVKYYACEVDDSKTACSDSEVSEYDSFASLNDALNSNENLKLSYLTYTLENVAPGSIIDFRVRLVTSVNNQKDIITLTTKSEYDEKGESSLSNPTAITGNASINITPFKARTRVYIDEMEQDVIINGANTSSSTWSIYPSVSLPIEEINTNAAGINALKTVTITVELPEGINYVYDERYNIPKVSGRTLTYVLEGKKVNEWIDPIYFVTNYNIDIPSGTEKEVKVLIDAETPDGIKDSSTKDLRTTIRKITYQNNEKIARSQYTTTPTISKETPFNISTKIYNNDSAKVSHSNLDIITLLPYNDISNENKTYTGTYTISNLPQNTLCTAGLPSLIKDSNLLSEGEIIWEDCTKYKIENNSYSGVTAIKIPSISLQSDQTYEHSITITPFGNKSDDKYTLKSYLVMNEDNRVRQFNDVTVEVFSKKITGIVWEDFDDNGIMDNEEKRISDVTLKLYDSNTNEFITSTLSDKTGNYTLSDLNPGTYYVVAEYNTAKYGLTQPNASYNRSVSSSFSSVDTGISSKGDEIISKEDKKLEDSPTTAVIKTDNITITNDTKIVSDINLGLSLKKSYAVKLTKYVSKVITTNNLGISTIKDYGNVSLAKLDVKDINNLSIKVIYTIELENVGYYPGYIYAIRDYIPDGMKFNESYEENKGWVVTKDDYLENDTLSNELVYEGDKKYLTIAFDITRKEAGSFINFASVEDDDLQILSVAANQGGNDNE